MKSKQTLRFDGKNATFRIFHPLCIYVCLCCTSYEFYVWPIRTFVVLLTRQKTRLKAQRSRTMKSLSSGEAELLSRRRANKNCSMMRRRINMMHIFVSTWWNLSSWMKVQHQKNYEEPTNLRKFDRLSLKENPFRMRW